MTEEKSKQGKKNRRKGGEFELKVRKDLESKGWIVAKWTNNVEFGKVVDIGKLIAAKRKFNPFSKALSLGTGFPDFICLMYEGSEKERYVDKNDYNSPHDKYSHPRMVNDYEVKGVGTAKYPLIHFHANFIVMGIEAKSNGYLTKEEKRKCVWLLENNIFSKIFVAKKIKGGIEYKEFKCD